MYTNITQKHISQSTNAHSHIRKHAQYKHTHISIHVYKQMHMKSYTRTEELIHIYRNIHTSTYTHASIHTYTHSPIHTMQCNVGISVATLGCVWRLSAWTPQWHPIHNFAAGCNRRSLLPVEFRCLRHWRFYKYSHTPSIQGHCLSYIQSVGDQTGWPNE